MVLRHAASGSDGQTHNLPALVLSTTVRYCQYYILAHRERERETDRAWWQLGKTWALIYKIIDIRSPEIAPSQ